MSIFEKIEKADAVEIDQTYFVRYFDYDEENKSLSISCQDGPELEITEEQLQNASFYNGEYSIYTENNGVMEQFTLSFYKVEKI